MAILFLNVLGGMDQKKNVMHQQLKSMRDLTYVGEKSMSSTQLYVLSSALLFQEQHINGRAAIHRNSYKTMGKQ